MTGEHACVAAQHGWRHRGVVPGREGGMDPISRALAGVDAALLDAAADPAAAWLEEVSGVSARRVAVLIAWASGVVLGAFLLLKATALLAGGQMHTAVLCACAAFLAMPWAGMLAACIAAVPSAGEAAGRLVLAGPRVATLGACAAAVAGSGAMPSSPLLWMLALAMAAAACAAYLGSCGGGTTARIRGREPAAAVARAT